MTMVGTGAPWQFELEKVEQRCDYLLKSRHWSDCFFEVGSEPNKTVVPAHKLILAMASPVFEEMFYGEHSELNKPMIPVSDVQLEAFRAFLQYIYTGKLDITSFDMAKELWLEAKKYKLPHLEKKCKSYVCSVVGPRNACLVYEFASQIGEKTLMDLCIQIISGNTKKVLNDRSFVDAKLDTVLTVLSLDQLNVDELELFDAVVKYDEALKRRGQSSGPPADSADGGPPAEELSESVEPPISEDKSADGGPPAEELSESVEPPISEDKSADGGPPAEELSESVEPPISEDKSADGGPPAEEVSESAESPTEDKASVLKVESNSQKSPSVELDLKGPSEGVVTSEPSAGSENLEEEVSIRAAIKKIRFLSMTLQQFAKGPARSNLLTKEEQFAVLMNIASRASVVPMPTGFSESRERRQQRNQVDQEPKPKSLKPCTVSYGVIAATQLPTPAKIVKDLASTDRNTLKAAARAARLMTKEGDNASEELVEAGVIPPLVAALDQPWSGVQYDAAIALVNLTADNEHAETVVDNGAVPTLVALLDRGGKLAEMVAMVIGNIALSNSEELVDQEALPELVSRMDANLPSPLLENYLWSYRMICEYEEYFSMEETVLQYIKDILVLTDEEVLHEACSILCHLTDKLAAEFPELFTPELTARLTALLGRAAPRVQTLALSALEDMLDVEELKAQCLGAGYVDHIIILLKCGDSSLVEDAARAAALILNGTLPVIQEALDKRILDPLGIILTERYHRCKLNAVKAVTCLCSKGSASQLRELAHGAALEPYCRLLSDDYHGCEVLRGLTLLLQNIEQNACDALCLKLQEFDVPKLLISMQEHEDELVRERAYYILNTYFGDDFSEKGRL